MWWSKVIEASCLRDSWLCKRYGLERNATLHWGLYTLSDHRKKKKFGYHNVNQKDVKIV